MSTFQNPSPPQFPQKLDRAALICIGILLAIIVALILSGEHSAPQVREFSWQDRQVGARDTAFVLHFSRPMDQASVKQNLKLDPDLPGRISWAGRRMVYTLDRPAPYGKKFTIQLQNAHDRFQSGDKPAPIQPFASQFQSRDRQFAYIGVDAEETGRLVLYNLSQGKKQILTPANLTVFNFEPYPHGDRILFSAAEPGSQSPMVEQKLYTVTTGIHIQPPPDLLGEELFIASTPAPAQKVTELLDNRDYQNLKFDLSDDGKTIVVQRASRKQLGQVEPWVLKVGEPPRSLQLKQLSGDFTLTPDGQSLLVTQGEGLAIVPLESGADPLDFLPKFGMVVGMSSDGTSAALVKFNSNYTKDLFLVSNQGVERKLLTTEGTIFSAQFSADRKLLYCLLTERGAGAEMREEPYVVALDLKPDATGQTPSDAIKPLLRLPGQKDVQISLAPDDVGLLMEETIAATTSDGQPTSTTQLWLLPLASDRTQLLPPQKLPFLGARPRWMP
jgi:hypothetical protein